MIQKTRGDSGNDVSQILGDKVVVVGANNPNILPSCRADGAGKSKNNVVTSSTQGVMEIPSTYTEYEAIDNSSDHHGGNYTLFAMNKANLWSAAGGTDIISDGNINVISGGGLINMLGTKCITLGGNVIKMAAAEIVHIDGKELYVDSNTVVFNNTVKINRNLVVNGGVSIQGELFANHITTTMNASPTSMHPPLVSYFYPDAMILGNATYVVTTVLPDGSVPPIGNMEILMMVDPLAASIPVAYTTPHRHKSLTTGIDAKESLADVWEEAVDCGTNERVIAKPNTPWGKAWENIVKNTKEMCTNAASDMLSQAYNRMFGSLF
jgi:hypothetical protein